VEDKRGGYRTPEQFSQIFSPKDIASGAGVFMGRMVEARDINEGGDYGLWFGRTAVSPIVVPVMGHWASQCRDIKVAGTLCRYGGKFGVKFRTVIEGRLSMDKKELIERICQINQTAKPEFLAKFSEQELTAYLEHLRELDLAELGVSG
jgi:hypothetical protein